MSLFSIKSEDWESDSFQNKFTEEYYQATPKSKFSSKTNSANIGNKKRSFSNVNPPEVRGNNDYHNNQCNKTKKKKQKLTTDQSNIHESQEQSQLSKKLKNRKVKSFQNHNTHNLDVTAIFTKKNKGSKKPVRQANKIKCQGKFPNKNLSQVNEIPYDLTDKHNGVCPELQVAKTKKNKRKRKNKLARSSPIESNVKFNYEKHSFGSDTYQKIKPFVEENDQSFSSQRSSLLREKTLKTIQAAKFRLLNEKMYTETGSSVLNFFLRDKDSFYAYHQGYQLQVSKWPVNPVDIIIDYIHQLPNNLIVADLGCGDAKIARTFPKRKVHSYDLVALNNHVTCCDISKVPLADGSVDIAIFCLSLMGTNLDDFILEAHRILKPRGLLKIAEVESRLDDLSQFIKSIEAHGFVAVTKDVSHKMFVLLDFNKTKRNLKKSDLPKIILKPCFYKKR